MWLTLNIVIDDEKLDFLTICGDAKTANGLIICKQLALAPCSPQAAFKRGALSVEYVTTAHMLRSRDWIALVDKVLELRVDLFLGWLWC